MKPIKTLLAAAALAAAFPAAAQFKTAGELFGLMNNGPGPDFVQAMGYVAGLVDSGAGFLICMPRGTTLAQAMQVVSRGLRESGQAQAQAAPIAMRALIAAYPCRQS